jgi:hypothetical protein
MATQIITNHQPRHIKYGYELAPKWRERFNWIEDDEEFAHTEFVEYKGWVYALSEFMRCEHELAVLGFDGYHSDTYFSGVLIKIVDSESVIMARYFS